MLCPYCIERKTDGIGKVIQNNIACTKTNLPVPQRLDRVLVRTGQWECPYCNFSKPIYAKQPQLPEELIKSTSCFCCNDSGHIHHFLVQKFLLDGYRSSDPLVPCRRCKAGIKLEAFGWDIATQEDCDRIHQAEIQKIKFSTPEPVDISDSINSLAESKSIRHKKHHE